MSNRNARPRVERGYSEEATGTPLTPAEEESSRRPASFTPGAMRGFVGSDEPEAYYLDPRDAAFNRLKELNPDDFE
jgi:hypothetical protein